MVYLGCVILLCGGRIFQDRPEKVRRKEPFCRVTALLAALTLLSFGSVNLSVLHFLFLQPRLHGFGKLSDFSCFPLLQATSVPLRIRLSVLSVIFLFLVIAVPS